MTASSKLARTRRSGITDIRCLTVGRAVVIASAVFFCLPSAFAQPSRSRAPTVPDPGRTDGEGFVTVPPAQDGPVVVRASFDLRDINDIDDEAETFEFAGVLTLRWNDPRHAFDADEAGHDEKIYLGAYQFNEMFAGWFPQVVLVNESGQFDKHGTVLRVRADGTLTLIETVDAAAEADLNLRRHPFDTQ